MRAKQPWNKCDEQEQSKPQTEIYPCIICRNYNGGSHAMNWVKDLSTLSGVRVTERACEECWKAWRKFLGQMQAWRNYSEYGFKCPWPPPQKLMAYAMRDAGLQEFLKQQSLNKNENVKI